MQIWPGRKQSHNIKTQMYFLCLSAVLYHNHHQDIILPSQLKYVKYIEKDKMFLKIQIVFSYNYSQYIYTEVFKISLSAWLMYFSGLICLLTFFRHWSNKNIVLSFCIETKTKYCPVLREFLTLQHCIFFFIYLLIHPMLPFFLQIVSLL